MKNLVLVLIFMMMVLNVFGQAGIKIYTSLDEARFKIVFDGEVENTIPIKEVSYDSLDYKKPHEFVLTFNSDTIADIVSEVYLLKDQVREFEILKKKEIIRKSAKIGRKIGKVLRIGKHDKEGIVYDVFYLEERTKSDIMNN